MVTQMKMTLNEELVRLPNCITMIKLGGLICLFNPELIRGSITMDWSQHSLWDSLQRCHLLHLQAVVGRWKQLSC
jgi:hypothetical protein